MLNGKKFKALCMLLDGYTQKEIAQHLNVSENTIVNWKKEEEFKVEYEKAINNITSEVSIYLKQLSLKAVKKLGDFLDCDDDELKYNAINNILDRTGFNEASKYEINTNLENSFASLNDEQLKKLINLDE